MLLPKPHTFRLLVPNDKWGVTEGPTDNRAITHREFLVLTLSSIWAKELRYRTTNQLTRDWPDNRDKSEKANPAIIF